MDQFLSKLNTNNLNMNLSQNMTQPGIPPQSLPMLQAQPQKVISKELLEKRQRNSEAARRCRDKVKQKIETLERENKDLLDEKRELYLKLVQTETMLKTAESSLAKANERIDMLEQRLSQFQKYILYTTQKEVPT
jgi:DNA repair exonuclease SbcCD ATPase subunit